MFNIIEESHFNEEFCWPSYWEMVISNNLSFSKKISNLDSVAEQVLRTTENHYHLTSRSFSVIYKVSSSRASEKAVLIILSTEVLFYGLEED